jgi:hypothetical protein
MRAEAGRLPEPLQAMMQDLAARAAAVTGRSPPRAR